MSVAYVSNKSVRFTLTSRFSHQGDMPPISHVAAKISTSLHKVVKARRAKMEQNDSTASRRYQ